MMSENGPGRVKTGVPGFDRLVGGGLPAGRLYVLCGPPGSGKTTFSVQSMATGLENGERGLYLTMHETREQLIHDMGTFDFGFDRLAASDRFVFANVFEELSPLFDVEIEEDATIPVSEMTDRLVSFIESQEIDRVVIDSTMLINALFSDSQADLLSFVTGLKRAPTTMFLISEMTDPTAYAPEHFLAHGVTFFHNFLEDGGMKRGIQVLKLRGVPIDTQIRPVRFTDRGLEVSVEEPMYNV